MVRYCGGYLACGAEEVNEEEVGTANFNGLKFAFAADSGQSSSQMT